MLDGGEDHPPFSDNPPTDTVVVLYHSSAARGASDGVKPRASCFHLDSPLLHRLGKQPAIMLAASLPSGWDERSDRIFNNTMQQLVHTPIVQVRYRAASALNDTRIGPVKVHQKCWRPKQDYWQRAIEGVRRTGNLIHSVSSHTASTQA